MAIDFDWSGFRALVKRLDDLLADDAEDPEFAAALRRAITFLYTAGVTMPAASDVYEDAGEEFWSSAVTLKLDAPDPAELEESVTALAQRIITSVDAVQPEGDVEVDDVEELAEATAMQILELTAALAEGSAHFDEERLQEAAWEWTFQFDEWGTQALAAVSALHELLWGAG
jgi:hypothetical protein